MAGQMELADYSYPPSGSGSAYPAPAYTIQTILAAGQNQRALHAGGVSSSQTQQSSDERFPAFFQPSSSSGAPSTQYSGPGTTCAGKTASYVEVIARKPSTQSTTMAAGSSNLVPMPPPASSPEPKRRRRGRVRFTDEQVQSLERRFREEQYLPASERNQLATSMELSESQVKTWFQNRRAKTKRALKRLRKVRAAQTAFNAGRQVPNVNIATTTWMNSSPAAMASSGSPYAFQQMQFGVDAIPSPPVSMATPMEAYLYCSPTESSTVAYPSQPTVPSANPHPQFVVGGLAVAGDTGHRHHMSPAYHASSNQVLPQYNDYMHVPLTTRTQRAASSDGPGSAVPLVRSGYTMPYVQLGDQPTYQHRHL